MHVEPRNPAHIEAVVIHTNEGPEARNGAASLARYLRTIQAGYHEVVDDHEVVVLADDDQLVYGAGGYNDRGYHICLVGYAAQTPEQWADVYSAGELNIAARRVAAVCARRGLPVTKLSGPDLLAHRRGVCGHGDVSSVYATSQGHTDPGPHFPWAAFLNLVRAGTPAPIVAGDDMPQIVEQPLRPGEGGVPRNPLKPQVAVLGKRGVRLLHGASMAGDRKGDGDERVLDVNTPSDLIGWVPAAPNQPGVGAQGGMVALNADGNPYHLAWS